MATNMTFKIDMTSHVISFYKEGTQVHVEIFNKNSKEVLDESFEKADNFKIMGDIFNAG